MTTFSLCNASLLSFSFAPKDKSPVRNVRVVDRSGVATERVLGAMYRLAREAEPVTLQRLALVIGLVGTRELVAPLARLARDGMIQRRGEHLALSLIGFAAAAALAMPRKNRRA